MSSEDRFGYEWNKYPEIIPEYESQFRNWVHPLGHEDFQGKKVLDAGCGSGRSSYWSLKWGTQTLVAFDFDLRSVAVARENLHEFNNARVLFKNIYEIDWQEEFDLVFSIGVIHHLKDPKLAIKKLVQALKTNGKLVLWVYSYDGNEWIVNYVSPLRKKIISKLPVRLVHWLSYLLSAPLWLMMKIFKPKNGYLKQLSTFKFWHMHSIVFDQLIPDVANYWKKEEVEELMADSGLSLVNIYRPENNCGWTIIGVR
ncbi:MAG: Methylase involved in ubiquinone/menaquinone biosynthesis [Candidatus Berkelbacteria bacterium]|nr:Methylase involved in ubiquinone/menaquinone biosynthesis [Candidatus Berkelbacteria bacterium]